MLAAVGSKAVVLLLLNPPIVCGGSGPCLLFSTLCASSFAIILMGKRQLVTLLQLYSWCLVTVT